MRTSFKSLKRIGRANVSLSSGLEQLASVSPVELRRAKKNADLEVTLTVTASSSAGIGLTQGQLEIRKPKRRGRYKVLADALPLTIQVVSSTPITAPPTSSTITTTSTTTAQTTSTTTRVANSEITSGGLIVRFSYPEGWHLTEENDRASLFDPTRFDPNSELVSQAAVTLRIAENTNGAPLLAFLSNYRSGWYLGYKSVVESVVAGYAAIVADDRGAAFVHSPNIATFVAVNNKVIIVASQGLRPDAFDLLVASLAIERSQ